MANTCLSNRFLCFFSSGSGFGNCFFSAHSDDGGKNLPPTPIKNTKPITAFKNIFFIGIGGISMSALAEMCISFGCAVSGSDMAENNQTKKLKNLGVKVFFKHEKNNISKDTDVVVYTGAIKSDNPELLEANKRNLPIFERSQFLGEVCKSYKNVIAVSGTHGKTTTTAIIGEIFNAAEKKPTIHIGGIADFGNLQLGEKDYFITEACEYLNSFSFITSTTALITNIDADHLDFYKTKENLKIAFENFVHNSVKNVILFEDIPLNSDCLAGKTVYICGFEKHYDCYAFNIKELEQGYEFEVAFKGKHLGLFKLKVFGFHNIKNALCAITVAYINDIEVEKIKEGLLKYSGVERRYEKIGKIGKAYIIADYAHHPTEISASLEGFKNKKVLAVFQPHTYSRTKFLLQQFKDCFTCEGVAIFKTYPAREKHDAKADEVALFNAINHGEKYCLNNNEELRVFLKNNAKYYDIVLVLGAGDIYDIVKTMFKQKQFNKQK